MSGRVGRQLLVTALLVIGLPLLGWVAAEAAQAENMRLVGFSDLQGRSAYQPLVHQQGGRWIAYVGLHGGSAVNPLTGAVENNGTLIIDVTNPKRPVLLRHIPGPSGAGEAGGAQVVRICNGADLPGGNPSRVYMLRTFGDIGQEVWNVANPSNPTLVATVQSGLDGTHKNWWECDTGIAYLVSGVPGWRTTRMTSIWNLSIPESPVHIRDYGLVGQEPGSTGPVPTSLHGPISLGQRVYFGHGTSSNGIVQIVDRTKLLTGPPEPTPENLRFPVISQVDLSPLNGAHTTFPVLGVPVPDLGPFPNGATRDILVVVNEATGNSCSGSHQMVYFMDVTREDKPQIISNYHVPDPEGEFCSRGGRFGAHSSNENMTPIYYGRIVFVSYFNAGVRAIDMRNPFKPVELGFYIPSTNRNAIPVGGRIVIQTNNVEVDNRGYIYAVDRAGNGLHILELTSGAREVANFPE
jgi:hypothetical protein